MTFEVQRQREYYTRQAAEYDAAHLRTGEGHDLASAILQSLIAHYDFRSMLDVGAGTGRTLRLLASSFPDRRIIGIEPVEAMRQVGYRHGLSGEQLLAGDILNSGYADRSFDIVTAFGVLHHIRRPDRAVAEMLRVARRAVFISDSNRFGQGPSLVRHAKWWSYRLGLWPLLNLIKTQGRGYHYGEGDGVAFSYSVFDNYRQIEAESTTLHLFSLDGSGADPLFGAGSIALLGLKR